MSADPTSMPAVSSWRTAPPRVKRASRLLLAYAGVVLAGMLWHAVETEFTQLSDLLRGLLRVAGITAIALWLPSLDRKAWWVAVSVSVVLAAIGLFGMVAVGYAAIQGDASLLTLLTRIVVPVYLLGHAAVILMQKDTRAHFGDARAVGSS